MSSYHHIQRSVKQIIKKKPKNDYCREESAKTNVWCDKVGKKGLSI